MSLKFQNKPLHHRYHKNIVQLPLWKEAPAAPASCSSTLPLLGCHRLCIRVSITVRISSAFFFSSSCFHFSAPAGDLKWSPVFSKAEAEFLLLDRGDLVLRLRYSCFLCGLHTGLLILVLCFTVCSISSCMKVSFLDNNTGETARFLLDRFEIKCSALKKWLLFGEYVVTASLLHFTPS